MNGIVTSVRVFRVILPVSAIDESCGFLWGRARPARRTYLTGRHYFGRGSVILACFDPRADGDPWDATPNPDHLYLAVTDLDACYQRVTARPNGTIRKPIETQPWGERSFYCADPFGNKLCFVDEQTLFTAGLI